MKKTKFRRLAAMAASLSNCLIYAKMLLVIAVNYSKRYKHYHIIKHIP